MFEQFDKMDELIDPRTVLHLQHLRRDLGDVVRGNFETRLPVHQEILDVLDLRQLEKAIQLSLEIKKDIERMDLLPARRDKIAGIAFEDMRHISPQPIDISASEGMHIVLCHERSLTFLDPGQLDLLVAVQMWIEVGELIFLNDYRFVVRHRNGKLEDLHHFTILALMAAMVSS